MQLERSKAWLTEVMNRASHMRMPPSQSFLLLDPHNFTFLQTHHKHDDFAMFNYTCFTADYASTNESDVSVHICVWNRDGNTEVALRSSETSSLETIITNMLSIT